MAAERKSKSLMDALPLSAKDKRYDNLRSPLVSERDARGRGRVQLAAELPCSTPPAAGTPPEPTCAAPADHPRRSRAASLLARNRFHREVMNRHGSTGSPPSRA